MPDSSSSDGSRRRPDPDLEHGQAPKKKRKQRQTFACSECRRLKMKCDRQGGPRDGVGLMSERLELEMPGERPDALERLLQASITAAEAPPIHPAQANPSTYVATAVPLASVGSAPTNVPPPASSTAQHDVVVLAPLRTTPGASGSKVSFLDSSSWTGGSPGSRQVVSTFGDDVQSSGTLLMAHGGRSKYLGPNASSEWLRDQETKESEDHTPAVSRMPSPKQQSAPPNVNGTIGFNPSFPFDTYAPTTTEFLLSKLPPLEEGRAFVDAYYRYFAWQYDVIPRHSLTPLFDRVYSRMSTSKRDVVSPQELALLYMIFAMGALYSLELPPNDPVATEYFMLSKACLVKGNFMVNTAISGVQTLHVMAHFHLETEEGRNGDPAWPLWGLAMRIAQAMGLHRDGESWGLPPEVIEERRLVFWESNAADIFQANNFSRPCSISPDYVDTKFPTEMSSLAVDGRGYFTLKWELTVLCGQVLDLAMKIRTPPYSAVCDLHTRLSDFEKNIPYPLRCRSALLDLPSMYIDSDAAIRDSPELRKRDLHRSLHQCTIAINVSEAFLFLHRPYFVKALREQHEDPTKSPFAQSLFSVIERCNVLIVVVATVHSLFPAIAVRHWFFWHHVFNSAVTMGTLIIRNPQNTLAPFALSQIDSAILLFARVLQSWPSPRLAKNLKWLHRLRSRGGAKLSAVAPQPQPTNSTEANGSTSDEEDVELVGWCTRLVQRAATGSQTAKTILAKAAPSPNVFSSPNDDLTSMLESMFQQNSSHDQGISAPLTSSTQADPSTDTILHEFWDPMLMLAPMDNFGLPSDVNTTWWDRDLGNGGVTEPN